MGTRRQPAEMAAASSPKVLISAFIGSDNLGDEAIFLSLAERLTSELREARFTALSVDPEVTRRLLEPRRDEALSMIRVKRRMCAWLEIMRHDVCVFGAGGIIQDQSSFFNLAYFLLQISLARALRKTVVLAFVGIGPVRSRIGKSWVRAALNGVPLCIARDRDSEKVLRALGVTGDNIRTAADIGLSLRCRPQAPPRIPAEEPFVLLCLRHWYDQERSLIPASFKSGRVQPGTLLDRLLDDLAEQFDLLLNSHDSLRIVAVPLFRGRDEIVHEALRARLPPVHVRRMVLDGPVAHPCDFLRIAASARCVIGMRLHALVLASVVGTPLVALSYSSKVASFMRGVGLDEYIINIETEPKVGEMAHCVGKALAADAALRTGMLTQVAAMQGANEAGLAALHNLIRNQSNVIRQE